MKRCNGTATRFSLNNGFRVCDMHVEFHMGEWEEHEWAGKDTGLCDHVIETKEQFWNRHPNSNMYNELTNLINKKQQEQL